RYIATVGADTLTRVWDTSNGHPVAFLHEHADEIPGVAFSPDGRRILSGSTDRTAKLYECVTCAPLDDVIRRARQLVRSVRVR
ncbi:MAG: hypothetical protein M3R70_10105, partial [Actinomycetota bacterium]|nr:hypothetical protein [Actinomycetota bacterium]